MSSPNISLPFTVCAISDTAGDDPKQDKVIELSEGWREPAISRDGIEAPQEQRPDRGVGYCCGFACSTRVADDVGAAGGSSGFAILRELRSLRPIHGRVVGAASMSSQ